MTPPTLTLTDLATAVAGADAAVRVRTTLAPAGGDGDKLFPPTYEGGRYAFEHRRVGDRVTETVLLDSVQSQANRVEQALKARAVKVGLPYLSVAVPRAWGAETVVTSLDAPHRIWDAIFRDSLWGDQPFRKSPEGARLVHATPDDATAFYEYAPTALVLGMWDSTSGEGGTGKVRWARALVSEVVGLDVVRGRKTSSRIDPLAITADAARIYRSESDGWTLDDKQATKEKGKPALFGKGEKGGKPSAINHGNVTPTIGKKGDEENAGGVTVSEARQAAVLSLPQLRHLKFPAAGGKAKDPAARDAAGRTVLAALALYGLAAAHEDGYFFRSRCHLLPAAPPAWELVGRTAADTKSFALDLAAAEALLLAAVKAAEGHGLKWPEPVELTPSKKLTELVKKSDEKAPAEEGADAGA